MIRLIVLRTPAFVRDYPWVIATLTALAVTLVLLAAGQPVAAQGVASVVALSIAAVVSVGMVKDLLKGHWGIDILAVTAIVSTVLVGEYLASLVVCLMITGGEALEDFAEGRARHDLSALLERAPQIAHRLDGDQAIDIPIDQVQIGDRLLVRPAEVVPVDGVLALGADGEPVEVDLDESSLTGESLPVAHRSGQEVMSGALNGQQAFVMTATALAADSQYSRILALVQEASESRSPMVRLADRYAVPFTALAYVIGGVGWWISGDPVRFAEVLVVATPCPLLIAAPVAFLGGMSRAAKNGVIVKSGAAIEQLGRIRTAAFDKTGTLTYGQPELKSVHPVNGFSAEEVLHLAASAEHYSSHVLAEAIRAGAIERGLPLTPATASHEVPAAGVRATIEGLEVVVGKFSWVAELTSNSVAPQLAAGEMGVQVGIDGQYAGVIILSDRVRPDAAATVSELGRLGVEHQIILTGDLRPTAEHVAQDVGIGHVEAELLPGDKVRLVQQASPRPVLMVGDGVNDAPVLAVADVGIAMGARGSSAASESADVVIITDDVSKVATAVAVGQRTLAVAKQSIWVGIVMSVGLMLIAVTGVLPAIFGALSQEVVDVVAILNSLRAMRAGRNEPGIRVPATADTSGQHNQLAA